MDHDTRGDASVVPGTAEKMSWKVVTLNDSPGNCRGDLGVNTPSKGHGEACRAKTERAGAGAADEDMGERGDARRASAPVAQRGRCVSKCSSRSRR